jgi:hypothetical protein
MREQEVRNLWEAYLEVCENQQLDEVSDELVGRAVNKRIAATGAANDTEMKDRTPENMRASVRAGEKEASMKTAAAKRRKRMNKEEVDLFDTILEHLVAEGYADTNEAALAIMANMSEEWIGSIVEAVDPDYTGPSQDPLSRASRAIGNAVKFATGQQAAEVRAKQKGVPGNVVVKQSGPFSTKNVPTKGSFISDTEMRRRGQSTQPMGPIGK